MAVGRISGPLLKDNLLRDGVNLAFETDLLFLDVINGRVGIKTKTPTNELSVSGTTRTTNLEVQTQADIATFTVTGSTIASTSGTINLLPSGVNAVVYQSKISVNSDLQITTNTIETTATNSNLAINTVGTGQVTVNANMLVNGDLHATGTITADGNIQLGNQTTDTVTFVAEVSSNILPTADNVYNLGSSSLVWANLYTNAITATNLTTTNFTATGVVNVAGTSTLSGNTTIGATTANTLTVNAKINSDLIPATNAQYNIGTALLLWNNLYGTTFTTTGLTVNGNTVTSTGTNSNLNLIANGSGSVTVPNNTLAVSGNTTVGGTLTVTGTSTLAAVGITGTLTQTGNFTQTSGNFSTTGTINSGAITSTGTLTLPNVTIANSTITGTTTATNLTLTPYAGRQVKITSNTQLDNNATVGGTLTVTGTSTLAAVGITGTLTQTGNFTQTSGNFSTTGTINSGAITSTGSLTLPNMTLSGTTITGTTTATNLTLTPYTGKQVEITSNAQLDNNATIAGTLTVTGTSTLAAVGITGTLTQTGNFTQSSGNFSTTGTINSGAITSTGSLTLPNMTLSGTTITGTTTATNLTLTPYTGKQVEITSSATVDQNLSVLGTLGVTGTSTLAAVGITGTLTQTGNFTQTGNTNITGNLTVSTYGQFEKIRIDSNVISTTATNTDLRLVANGTGKVLVPSNNVEITNNLTVNGTTTLGTLNATTVNATTLSDGEINITDNYVTTTTTNRNLELRANGTGKILVPSNTFEVTNNLTVTTGTTSLKATTIVGDVNQTGGVNQTGNYTQTGNLGITGNLTVSTYGQFEKIRIDSNTVSTTATNTDLRLVANGTGKVIVPTNTFEVTNDLTVNGLTTLNTLTATTVTATTLSDGEINITDNYVTTTTTNRNLELRANGTGKILVPSNTVEVTNNLTVTTGTTNLKATAVVGNITHTGSVIQTGNYTQTGNTNITGNLTVSTYGQFEKIRIDSNVLSTTATNTDLSLQANGSGKVIVPNNNVEITNDLTVNGTTRIASLTVDGTLTATTFNTGNINIISNYVTTTLTNSNLELRANGTGKILVPSNTFEVTNNLTVTTGTTSLKTTGIVGTLTQTGDITQTGNVTQTGDYGLTGTLTVGSTAQFKDVKIDNNIITTTLSNNDLQLSAAGTGRIYVPTNNVRIDQNLSVGGTTTTADITSSGTITAVKFTNGNVAIGGSEPVLNIHNTTYSTNYDFVTFTVGAVPITQLYLTKYVGVDQIAWFGIQVGSAWTAAYNIGQMLVQSHFGPTTSGYGVGDNVLATTATVLAANTTYTMRIQNTGSSPTEYLFSTVSSYTASSPPADYSNNAASPTVLTVTDSANAIQTVTAGSNLELRAAGTGLVRVEQLDIQENEIKTNTNADIILSPNGTGIVNVNSTQSIQIPVGTTTNRPTASAGMVRFNTTLNRYEGYNGTNWIRLDGLYDLDENTYVTAEATPGANDNTFRFVTNGTQVADLNATRFSVLQADISGININNNTISTTAPNTDIVLQTTGTGAVKIGNFAVNNNTITNTVAGAITTIAETTTGYFKIAGTNGFVLPSGDSNARPTAFETGMMRFNTTDVRVEIWSGTAWISASGTSGGIIRSEAEDIGILSAIIFG